MLKINFQKGSVQISTFAGMAIMAAVVVVSTIAVIKYREVSSVTLPVTVITPKLTQAPLIATPSPAPEINANLDTYTDKELLGENQTYSVYAINQKQSKPLIDTKGELVVYDKNKKIAIRISGLFYTSLGATLVFNDDKEKYILLSNGTGIERDTVAISLSEKKQTINDFCSMGNILFWEDHIIYRTCGTYVYREGEGNVTIVNLLSGQIKVLLKADNLHDFTPRKIEKNTLFYEESSVKKETDWDIPGVEKTVAKTFILSAL